MALYKQHLFITKLCKFLTWHYHHMPVHISHVWDIQLDNLTIYSYITLYHTYHNIRTGNTLFLS